MANIYDILILADIANGNSVKMYSGDQNIVVNGQGTHELWVKVRSSSQLRWRVVPLQMTTVGEDGTEEVCETIITKVRMYTPTNNYLIDWSTSNGPSSNKISPIYDPPGNVEIHHDAGSTPPYQSADLPITTVNVYDPFVQCTTTIGRDQNTSGQLCYNFCITPYKNGTPQPSFCFDPYVTVYN